MTVMSWRFLNRTNAWHISRLTSGKLLVERSRKWWASVKGEKVDLLRMIAKGFSTMVGFYDRCTVCGTLSTSSNAVVAFQHVGLFGLCERTLGTATRTGTLHTGKPQQPYFLSPSNSTDRALYFGGKSYLGHEFSTFELRKRSSVFLKGVI